MPLRHNRAPRNSTKNSIYVAADGIIGADRSPSRIRMPKPQAAPIKKRRSTKGENTRNAILAAAATLFAAKGYDATGVREIAESVGVNPALINLYFGSKEKLFAEVMRAALDAGEVRLGDHDQLGQQWARFTVQGVSMRQERLQASNQALQLLIRSSGSAAAAETVRHSIGEWVVRPIAARLEGEHVQERAALIATYLLGFALMQRVIGLDALAGGDAETLIKHLARAAQDCVEG